MVKMSKLFVVNHLKDNVKGTVQSILTSDQILLPGTDYKVSPIELGFDYVISLFDKFETVEFDTDHTNYSVLLHQSELQTIYANKIKESTNQILDTNLLNFFGCSHTRGIGHVSKLTTYPNVLSELMLIDYNNFGLPGKGNYDIEDLLTLYSIKNSKLIIQFTDMYRVRYLHNGHLLQNGIYRINHNHPVLFSEENLFFNFKKIVNRIVTRLRDGNNQFLITYTNNIDNEWAVYANLFFHEYREYSSAVGTQIDVANDGAHYGINTHKLWADRLYKKWIELYGRPSC